MDKNEFEAALENSVHKKLNWGRSKIDKQFRLPLENLKKSLVKGSQAKMYDVVLDALNKS